jgi:tetratricopeptide (TPR) repeat protein
MARKRAMSRWRAPLPVPRSPEHFFGFAMLEEVRGAAGGALWDALRVVEMWSGVTPAERPQLFEAGARRLLDERLELADEPLPLSELHAILGLIDGTTDAEDAALACRAVARWAGMAALPRTETAFTQAAAMAEPSHPLYALEYGLRVLAEGDSLRAEAWFRRTAVLARQQGDRETYARAHLWIGQALVGRGAARQARRSMLRSLRAAERHGLRYRQAHALHGLLIISAEMGDLRAGLEYGLQASRAYGPGHPEVPRLASDVATIWMERGEFDAALPVLTLAARLIAGPHRGAWGGVARAAGQLGRVEEFEEAVRHVEQLVPELPFASGSYLDVARGALGLGRLEVARSWGERALTTADRRAEYKMIFTAEAFLEALEGERAAVVREPMPPGLGGASGALREELERSLRAVAARAE